MTQPARPRLTWLGRCVLVLIAVVGLAPFVWAGLLAGTILGLETATPALDRPGKRVELAQDLSGLVDATVGFGTVFLAGVGIGLLVGMVVMVLIGRYLLGPLLSRVPRLGVDATDRGR